MRLRRLIPALLLGLSFATVALPQEPAPNKESQEAAEPDSMIWWKWANFAILAGGLGFLVSKSAPAFFKARSEEIQHDMVAAAKAKAEAEAEAAAMEKRFAGLKGEIEQIRSTARTEIAADEERMRRETEQHMQRIKLQAQQEIVLMQRVAQAQLRKYSAQLALDLAEKRIGSRMTPEVQDRLADGFLQDLRYQVTPGART